MTQQEIQERNKQIALMLGYVNTTPTDKDFNIFERSSEIGVIPKMIETMSMKFHTDWNWLMEAVEFVKKNIRLSSNTSDAEVGEYFIDEWEFKVKKFYIRLIQWTGTGWKMFDKEHKDLSIFYIIGVNCQSEKEAIFLAISDFAKKFNNMDYIPKEKTKCTCKKHDPYCCQIHGTCPTCVKQEELKTNLERLPFLELIKEFAEYYKKVPLVEEPKQECTCENPTDNTCGYCEKENKIKILEEAKKRALEEETLEEAACKALGYDYNDWVSLFSKDKSTVIYSEVTNWCKGAKYMAERMYSEEEVYKLLLKHQSDYRSSVRNSYPLTWSFDIKEWFEQFKKKQ